MNKLLLLALVLFGNSFLFSQDLNYALIDDSLIEKIEEKNEDQFGIYIILEDRTDLDALESEMQKDKLDNHARTKKIITTLQNKSKTTQRSLLNNLAKMPGVDKGSIQSYWICNSIFLTCDLQTIAELSHDDRLEWIGLNAELQLTESIDEETEATLAASLAMNTEIGLGAINAPAMWELGYTGYGQIALVADTGIDPTHPAYSSRYRGNTTRDEEAWFQGEFFDNESPFACGDHGSHVLGTVLGLDRINEDTIGVAYNAQWMGSPNLCFGTGTASNLATFQWAVNPDGDVDTSEDIADVINNSWWDPGVRNSECNSLYVDLLDALEMIGVAVIFSAGNAGPEPESITPPKNISLSEVNVFCVANIRGDSFTPAESSSRGPSVCGGEGSLLIKPEVSAPGVSVRSAVFEQEYGLKSGTSMAAPHVSGSILLLKEAFPYLRGEDLKWALYLSCRDLGDEGEDNTYGMGIIDVRAAYIITWSVRGMNLFLQLLQKVMLCY